ncbi:MAG: SYNERG-CTERM sorting domain-containing protein [Synergistaceae bacterium]|nr:SYNERG-CTERM sorting domain-containing protein [Synergistaceae bacterium]
MKRVLALALALCALCVPAGATVWNVDTAARLSEALDGAKDGDTINLAAGTYSITSALYVEASITIRGADRATTILDGGGGEHSILRVATAGVTPTVTGLTFRRGGYHGLSIGGFDADDNAISCGVTVEDCDFKNNASGNDGAAVYMENETSASFKNCAFTNNTSTSEGGAILGHGELTLENCVFTDNAALGGGGAVYAYGNLTARNCVFTGNNTGTQYTSDGGAIHTWNSSGNVTIEGCSFADNTCSDDGGALWLYPGSSLESMTITDCDFTGNSSASGGGAIYAMGSKGMTVRNCSFADNKITAGGYGGGVAWTSSGEMTLVNCVFTGNNSGNGAPSDPGATSSRGGAVYRFDGSVTAVHCTFVNNLAQQGMELYSGYSMSGTQMNIVNSIIYNASSSNSNPAVYTGQESVGTPNTEAVKMDNCAATSDVLDHAGINADGCKAISSWTPARTTFRRANGHTATVVQATNVVLVEGDATMKGKALSAVSGTYGVNTSLIEKDMAGQKRDTTAPDLGAVNPGTIPEPEAPAGTPPVISSFAVTGVADGGTLVIGNEYTATATASGEGVTWSVEADAALTVGTPGEGNSTTFTVTPNAASDAATLTLIARNDNGAVRKTLTFKTAEAGSSDATSLNLEPTTPTTGSQEENAIKEELPGSNNDGSDSGGSEGGSQEGEVSIGGITEAEVRTYITAENVRQLDAGLLEAVTTNGMRPFIFLPQLQPTRTGIYLFKVTFSGGRSGALRFFPGEGGTVNGASLSLAAASTDTAKALFFTDETYQTRIESLSPENTSLVAAVAFEQGKTYTPIVALESEGGEEETQGGSAASGSGSSSSGCNAGAGLLALAAIPAALRKSRR